MTNDALRLKLHKLTITCDINQRYHQILTWRWMLTDKIAKILVALTASLALMATFFGEHWKVTEIAIALIALVAAIILNVAPFGEYEKSYERLFQGWSRLRKSADSLLLKIDDDAGDALAHCCEHFLELQNEMNLLNAEESAPYRTLLARCEGDSKQHFFGFRTNDEIEKERSKRQKANHEITSSASAAVGPG
jgi:hypothetical protein